MANTLFADGLVIPHVTLVGGSSGATFSAPPPTVASGSSGAALAAPHVTLVSNDGNVARLIIPHVTLVADDGNVARLVAPALALVADQNFGATVTPPAPTIVARIGQDGVFVGTIAAPQLAAAVVVGTVGVIIVQAAAPVLVATLSNPSIITASPQIPAPRLTAVCLNGGVGTAALVAVAPIMTAAGYPTYTVTFAGSVPAPYINARLDAALQATYDTWVLNTRKGALTQYDNFAFESFAVFNNQVLAVNASGVVVLGAQDQDVATAINAIATTGAESFASSRLKRVPRIYVGHRATGDMLFRTITTEGGTRTYPLSWNNISGVQQRRVPVGKGPKSRFWQFQIANVNGADFAVEDVLVYPMVLRRRVQ